MNIYPFIEAEKVASRNVARACELMEVSRSQTDPAGQSIPVRVEGGHHWFAVDHQLQLTNINVEVTRGGLIVIFLRPCDGRPLPSSARSGPASTEGLSARHIPAR